MTWVWLPIVLVLGTIHSSRAAPLHDAAGKGDIAAIRRLLRANADINEKLDGITKH
jgi:hypothetical protein